MQVEHGDGRLAVGAVDLQNEARIVFVIEVAAEVDVAVLRVQHHRGAMFAGGNCCDWLFEICTF